MNIPLRFINRSKDLGASEVVLFQRNVIPDFDELAIAWKVIRYCGHGCLHPFVYSTETEVSIGDDYGNYSPRLSADDGDCFTVSAHPTGRGRITRDPVPAHGPTGSDIEVANRMRRGAVNVNAYSAGRLIAAKQAVAPGQKAVFRFTPMLWIAAVSQVQEGHALNSAVLSSENTEFVLSGVTSADIVMTGGGGGAEAEPLRFALENVVRR
ncbi:hypothetical protein [Paraburkholderia sp.]|uniref:hypothetical protein n=1 Tax=Paraburkholderia sp. TaxID=1926495 RepID=UPI003D6FB1E8